MDIGKKIKELRLQNDLTLENLASRCELTKGFLSQVERNLTSPSISTLEDILEALGTNLSEFFHEDKMEPIVLTLHPHKQSHELQSHAGEEFGYVLKGNITLVRGNKRYKLKPKETFYINGRTSHYLYNHGNSDAVVLWITTPPMF